LGHAERGKQKIMSFVQRYLKGRREKPKTTTRKQWVECNKMAKQTMLEGPCSLLTASIKARPADATRAEQRRLDHTKSTTTSQKWHFSIPYKYTFFL